MSILPQKNYLKKNQKEGRSGRKKRMSFHRQKRFCRTTDLRTPHKKTVEIKR